MFSIKIRNCFYSLEDVETHYLSDFVHSRNILLFPEQKHSNIDSLLDWSLLFFFF